MGAHYNIGVRVSMNSYLNFFKIMAQLIKETMVFGILMILSKVLLMLFNITKSIFTYVTYLDTS